MNTQPSQQHDDLPSAPSQQAQSSSLQRPRKWVKRVLYGLLAVLAACMVFVAWLVSSESGLRFALFRLPTLAGVHIQAERVEGTVIEGFSGTQWQIDMPSAQWQVSDFGVQWQAKELWQRLLHIQNIQIGDVVVESKPVPPTPTEPRQLPTDLTLPLDVQIDSIRVRSIRTLNDTTPLFSHLDLAFQHQNHRHQLNIKSLHTPWGFHQGNIQLNSQTPFALQGNITGYGDLEGVRADGQVQLSGDLQRSQLQAKLVGGSVALKADMAVSIFENSLDKIIHHANIESQQFNPASFLPSAPQALLDIHLTLLPSHQQKQALDGTFTLLNHKAMPSNQQGIPVRQANGKWHINEQGVLNIQQFDLALLQAAHIQLNGSSDTKNQTINLKAEIKQFSLPDVVQTTFAERIDGMLHLTGSYQQPQLQWQLNSQTVRSLGQLLLHTDKTQGQRSLVLQTASLEPKAGGALNLTGKMDLFQQQAVQLKIHSKQFNPARVSNTFPVGNINGTAQLDGELAQQKWAVDVQFQPSTLSGVPLSGMAKGSYAQQRLTQVDSNIILGQNRLKLNGNFGQESDRLNVDIAAPDLHKFGFGVGGALHAKGFVSGSWQRIQGQLAGKAQQLKIGDYLNIGALDFDLRGSPHEQAPLNIAVHGKALNLADNRIDQVDLDIRGTLAKHSIHSQSQWHLQDKPYRFVLSAQGGWQTAQQQWRGSVEKLDISGVLNVHLQNRLNLQAGKQNIQMGAARWSALGGHIHLQHFQWDTQHGIRSKGDADHLQLNQLATLFTLPIEQNLVLGGDWDVQYSHNTKGYVRLRQQSGDIVLPTRNQMLGLKQLQWNSHFADGKIDNHISGSTRYGEVKGNIVVNQHFGQKWHNAPLNGNIQMNIADLNSLKNLLPIGNTVRGSLFAQAKIAGTLGQPQLNGQLNGDNLYYVNRPSGLVLDNGILRSRLQGQTWVIDQLQFTRGGTVNLKGEARLDKGDPDVNVQITFDKYQAMDTPSRRLSVSGNTQLRYFPSTGIGLEGSLSVDNGRFGLQKASMPTLDDDIVVLGETPIQHESKLLINMNLLLDLNNKLRFVGEGLDVTLGGRLRLFAQPKEDIQVVGTVNVVKGKYKAYAQDLNITKGNISFVGPIDNPNLNIRAVRNLSPVGAGVEVLGNLDSPRVTLVADEAMSEKDKLSWLILNRASSGSDGDEATLSAAAGALVAGQINDRIGLVDDFGFTSQRNRDVKTGVLSPAEQVLTVGKQLSNNLYIGYEYGIASASQSVKLIYQLTKAIQAIARVGSHSSGGELRYMIRFD